MTRARRRAGTSDCGTFGSATRSRATDRSAAMCCTAAASAGMEYGRRVSPRRRTSQPLRCNEARHWRARADVTPVPVAGSAMAAATSAALGCTPGWRRRHARNASHARRSDRVSGVGAITARHRRGAAGQAASHSAMRRTGTERPARCHGRSDRSGPARLRRRAASAASPRPGAPRPPAPPNARTGRRCRGGGGPSLSPAAVFLATSILIFA